MQEEEDKIRNRTWHIWLFMIKLSFALCVVFLTYLVAGKHIDEIWTDMVAQVSIDKSKTYKEEEAIYKEDEASKIRSSGLIYDKGVSIVEVTCLACHSSALITQNRATREGWKSMIRWMQKSQGLPMLGDREPIILDYLANNYAPKETGRRKNIDIEAIEWYVLELK